MNVRYFRLVGGRKPASSTQPTPISSGRNFDADHHDHRIQAGSSDALEHSEGDQLVQSLGATSTEGESGKKDIGEDDGRLPANSVTQPGEDDSKAWRHLSEHSGPIAQPLMLGIPMYDRRYANTVHVTSRKVRRIRNPSDAPQD
ncbi:MAG: hypothetical protein Q9226_003850 [Calogaya cf. arnoldii]